jgi:phosphoribosylanthranilate isomerase
VTEFSDLAHFIKICGITTLEDARCATQAGADAIGLIFASSPRQLSLRQAVDLTEATRGSILRVGVFRDSSTRFVCDAVDATGVEVVQVHGTLSDELLGELRDRRVAVIKALSVTSDELVSFDEHCVDAVLIDGPRPGSGVAHTWNDVAQRFFQRPLIAAGGLTPANVAEVLAMTGAWGADVASGVEASPGRKDPLRVRDFVQNASAFFEQREESRE